MIKFGFNDYTVEMPNWSKHHQEMGVHVKRVYPDGKVIEPKDETLLRLMRKNGNLLKEKSVLLFTPNGEQRVTDYYLPLQNQQYADGRLSYYSVGAMNTKQTTHIRYSFQIEEASFKLDYAYKSSGSYASSFFDQVRHLEGAIEEAIEEILEKGLSKEESLAEYGIATGEEDFEILVIDDYLDVQQIDILKHELLKSLVGIEIYKFEQEIV